MAKLLGWIILIMLGIALISSFAPAVVIGGIILFGAGYYLVKGDSSTSS